MTHNNINRKRRWARMGLVCLLTALVALPMDGALAQRGGRSGGGSFGGGRSFSGGSFGRSSGGSFGGSRSFGGSSTFGRSSSGSVGGSRSFSGSSSGGSFGRSGSFGSSGVARSSSVNSGWNRSTNTYYQGGRGYSVAPGFGGGFLAGYSLGMWSSPAWYFYTPFHPAFYVGRPYVGEGGYMYPGGFNWLNFFLGIVVFIFMIWLLGKIFFGGMGGRRVRYTSY